ncbi:glycosyl hydrolase family 28 protein [Maribacter ulvicola]|uniref:Glycosyl hydrolases family 28 n=1 Tax=Maribacter ulvicola TaxID=228959 RepID=A0A1N6X6Z2_9FLAO|nr:glycosyl hydrolase family 28 protein [Maribacter ulvicola]SIQ98011.1 Glycosyl hydrolases family 28 [Maribacter ulvicola]
MRTKSHVYLKGIVVMLVFSIATCLNYSCKSQVENRYITYDGQAKSDTYQVTVNNDSVFVAKESFYGNKTFHTTQFAADTETVVRITSKDPINSFKIKPAYLNIKAVVKENELVFTLNKPEKLFIEINDYKPLCLFSTPTEQGIPDPNDLDVLYFKKGVHNVGVLRPKNNQTIYLEQGAIVKGRVYGENVKNITIKGRGIIDARGFTSKKDKICGLEFKNSDHIKIEGIGLRTGIWWQSLFLLCNDVDISHMNLMSFGENNDGIDIDGVTNFKVTNSFIGCGDDGFGWHALDAEANGEPDTANCIAENCVIYNAYAGNGIRLGASMETKLFKNITFKNIAVLDHVNAAIRSDHSDWAVFKNVKFENFYIEKPSRPIEIRIEKTGYSNNTGFKNERGHFDGLHFENIHANGGKIILEGYDETHLIENVSFTNCYNKDVKLKSTNDITINDFVRNISFK